MPPFLHESMNITIEAILSDYSRLLARIDSWYSSCQAAFPTDIRCSKGCSDCCRSLFDITLLDAVFLKTGFDLLPEDIKSRVTIKAKGRLRGLRKIWPGLSSPYLLNHRPEEDWQELMPEDDETPCVLLGDDGRCLVYAHRPMTCRLHGLPLVDPDGEVQHDEWCTMNFPDADPLQYEKLRADFTGMFKEEVALFRRLETVLLSKGVRELDTFIPLALLVDYLKFDWHGWGERAETDRHE